MSTEGRVSYRDKLAEAMRIAFQQWINPDDDATNAPEVGEHFAHAARSVRDAELDRLSEENDRLAARVAEYENAITWETSCLACSATLDSSIKEHERAERAEAERDALKAGVASAIQQIREWMNPDAPPAVLFDPGHASEVEVLLKKHIGEHTIAALGQPPAEPAHDGVTCAEADAQNLLWQNRATRMLSRVERAREIHDRTCSLQQAIREHPDEDWAGATCEMCAALGRPLAEKEEDPSPEKAANGDL